MMHNIIISCLALSAQALQQQSLSIDPAFKLADESSREVFDNELAFDNDAQLKEKETEEGQEQEFGMKAEELMSRLSVFPDLTPSDFKFKSSQQFKSPTANLGYYGAVIAFGILI